MRRDKANEFPGCYDFGFLPELREMLLIARDQVVRPGGIGTFQKYVVIGVGCNLKALRWSDDMTMVLDKLKQLLPEAFANP